MRIIERIRNARESRVFNARNCLMRQNAVESHNINRRIEEIELRIKYVVESTTQEHTVIYQVHDYEKRMFHDIKRHFENLGFKVIDMEMPELDNDEYMIISWKKDARAETACQTT